MKKKKIDEALKPMEVAEKVADKAEAEEEKEAEESASEKEEEKLILQRALEELIDGDKPKTAAL